jgi:iron complex outermembrane receptor protein
LARYASSELGDRYYDDFATKQMEIFSLKQIIKLPINLVYLETSELRNVHYKANATETGL